MNKEIKNEIIDSMVTSILAELVSTYTDKDPLDIGLELDELVPALKGVNFQGDIEGAIYNVWDNAYDNVVCGDGEYWMDEYGLYGEEVEAVLDGNVENKIVKKVVKLLK